MKGMTSPAADHRPGAINISADINMDPEQLSASDVDTVLGIRPARLVARRALLANLGRMLQGEINQWSPKDHLAMVRFIDQLPTGDERWLLWGLTYDTVPPTENPEPLPDELMEAIDSWPESLQGRLLRQARQTPAEDSVFSHRDGPQGRSRELLAQLATTDDSMLRTQLAWEIGLAAAAQADLETGPDVSATEQLQLAFGTLPLLSPDTRPHARRSIIDAIVNDRCDITTDCASLKKALSVDQDAFDEAVCVHHLRCDQGPS
jgi:hypothetical protein